MKRGRKPGSLVNATCCICRAVVQARSAGINFRCQACIESGRLVDGVLSRRSMGKHYAGLQVQAAIREGRLPDPATLQCVDCAAPALEYEHRDYNQPLMVVPICRSCNLRRGPAIPVAGTLFKIVKSGGTPYRSRHSTRLLLKQLGHSTEVLDSMPATLTHAHWVQLLPLFEQVSEAA